MMTTKQETGRNAMTGQPMTLDQKAQPGQRMLKQAVLQHAPVHPKGILERMFTWVFSGFVYSQIWEDPEIDIEALKMGSSDRIMTIASGGCNILNYLTEGPAAINAVDLNPSHIALTRLKVAALKHLPDYESFFAFFGKANEPINVANYDKFIKPHLDADTRAFWEKKNILGKRRIEWFSTGLYRHGWLGISIAFIHLLAKLGGQDPRILLTAQSMDEQKTLFDRHIGPLFKKPLVRAVCNTPVSFFGLGIPPAQFEAMAADSGGDMAGLVGERMRRMACDYPIQTNYFAWQAFGRGYDSVKRLGVPRYLEEKNYAGLKEKIERVTINHTTLNEFMEKSGDQSIDSYVFLDAQDWMNSEQLNDLWSLVMKTARPGARVIFRTAGTVSPLESALPASMLERWEIDEEKCREWNRRDRSSIYGGFHCMVLKG
jgi:S-adenosylmethionine-diacylglycerol 3-amino-3-carboxypropyl transferase